MSMKRKARDKQDEPPVSGASPPESSHAPSGYSISEKHAKKSRHGASSRESTSKTENLTEATWPEHFRSLFKIFKAVNTVVAFVCSKRQLAVSFSSVRSSVEGLLKHPLEISSVAEIKALLPDLVRFAYVPALDLPVQEPTINPKQSMDYLPAMNPGIVQRQEHVLVLDFTDGSSGRRTAQSGSLVSNMSTKAVKKLIESRNEIFRRAVQELITATSNNGDPADLIRNAGLAFVPINTSAIASKADDSQTSTPVPCNERASIAQIIEQIRCSAWYKDQIVYQRSIKANEAVILPLDPPISQTVLDAITKSRNIQSLYSHQAAAINAIHSGRNVIVSTSTASGKSVIYQIPVMSHLEQNPDATAIFIFPTKALAQDQKASLEKLFQMSPAFNTFKIATYDGDTPQEIRADIREKASVIMTNFDTLHASILPNEEAWRRFFKRLQILVVDELHYYTGLLGSHVAYILRRFRRVCAAVGNRWIRFVTCSATLSNPAEHMSALFALGISELDVIANDGAPSGSKEYIIWNPPLVDATEPSLGRYSAVTEASNLMRFLMKEGVRVILFCKIRKVCELVTKTIKADLANEGRLDILDKVRPYRGGYSSKDRRQIEDEAFSGALLGIVATNALELGIDIGALDAVIMLGFPMAVSNFKQQAGRAGRRSRDSLAILVAEPFPIDQHYVQHPSDLFENPLEDLSHDVENELVLEAHLQCAAHEIPLNIVDEQWFGPLLTKICSKSLIKDDDGWFHPHPKYLPYPSRYVAIRGAREDTYMVVEIKDEESKRNAYALEEVEISRALFELYEGAVFIHQGESFIIREICHDEKIAKAIRSDVNYITSPRDLTRVEPLQTQRSITFDNNITCQFGRINVYVKVFGFFKIRGKAILDAVELATPPWERQTAGFWIDLPSHLLRSLREAGIDSAAAIHSAEHAFLNQFSLAQDVKTDCRVAKEGDAEAVILKEYTRYPRIIFYDAAGKTGGIVSRAYEHVQNIIRRAQTVIDDCTCADGCHLCIHSHTCKDANLISSKLGASIILNGLAAKNIDDTYSALNVI